MSLYFIKLENRLNLQYNTFKNKIKLSIYTYSSISTLKLLNNIDILITLYEFILYFIILLLYH